MQLSYFTQTAKAFLFFTPTLVNWFFVTKSYVLDTPDESSEEDCLIQVVNDLELE